MTNIAKLRTFPPNSFVKCAHQFARIAAALASIAGPGVAWADSAFQVDAGHEGFREYYCVTLGSLTNTGAVPIREINGYFVIFQAGEEIGRSRGTSFLNVGPGETAEARFEAPNSPCDQADAYEFVVSACMRDQSFIDKAACASEIVGVGKVRSVSSR